MKHKISDDRRTLTISIDFTERAELTELLNEQGDFEQTMWEFFEPLVCNSELEWVNSEDTGDLTDAPMLGIRDRERRADKPIVLERWAFMDYQVRSVLDDLRDKGEAIFTS